MAFWQANLKTLFKLAGYVRHSVNSAEKIVRSFFRAQDVLIKKATQDQ